MTILFFARRFFPDIGGVETHVLNVSEHLLRLGHRVIIVCEASEGTTENVYYVEQVKNSQNNVKWQMRYISDKMTGKAIWPEKSTKKDSGVSFPTLKLKKNLADKNLQISNSIIVYRMPKVKEGRTKKLHIWHWLWKHKYLMSLADVIHCHDVFFWYMPFRLLYFKKRVFTTFHGYESYPIKRKAILIRKLSEVLSNGNLCIGDYLKKWYHTKPTFISYGAISTQKVKASARPPSAANTLSVLLLGRLSKDIGVSVYLDAIRELKRRGINVHFSACGNGPLLSEVKKLGKAYGFVSDVEKYIASSNIVFAASYLSILEALKYNKMIISVYENPLKEDILRMTPYKKWITIVDSSSEIVSAIEMYIREGRKSSDEAKQWIQKQTWENLTETYITLWQK